MYVWSSGWQFGIFWSMSMSLEITEKKFNSIDNTYIPRESLCMGGSRWGREDPPPLENHTWLFFYYFFRKSGTDTLQEANEPGGSNCFSRDVNTVNPALSGNTIRRPKIGFQVRLSLNEGLFIAECSKRAS